MGLVMLATSARGDTRLLHRTARRRAEEEGSGLLVVHVLSGADYQRQPPQLRQAIRDEMTWLLHALVVPTEASSGFSLGRIVVDIREGDIVEQLIEAAESSRPDLVVLGEPRPDGEHALREDGYARLLAYFDTNSIPVECVGTG